MTEYERLGGWKGLPLELWGVIEEYTDWDVKLHECAPMYDLTSLLEDDPFEQRQTEEVLWDGLEDGTVSYRIIQKICQRLGIKAGRKKQKLIKEIGNLVPNCEISRYLKCGEIDNFTSIAEYHVKERLKEEHRMAQKRHLYDLHIRCGLLPAKAPDGTILYWYSPR